MHVTPPKIKKLKEIEYEVCEIRNTNLILEKQVTDCGVNIADLKQNNVKVVGCKVTRMMSMECSNSLA